MGGDLLSGSHIPRELGRAQDALEAAHRGGREPLHGVGSCGDDAPGDADLEPHLGLGRGGIFVPVLETETKRHGGRVLRGEARAREAAEGSHRVRGMAEVGERDQIDDERQVPHEPLARLIQVDVNARTLGECGVVEEEVRAPGRLPFPLPLELVTGRLLEPGERPAGLFDPRAYGLDQRLEREERTPARPTQERPPPRAVGARGSAIPSRLTLLPGAV